MRTSRPGPLRRFLTAAMAAALVAMGATTAGAVTAAPAQAAVTETGVTSVTIPDAETLFVKKVFDLNATWEAAPGAKGGDVFTLDFPSEFQGSNSTFDLLEDGTNAKTGTCTVSALKVTCTLSDYINGKTDVKGKLSFKATAMAERAAGPIDFTTGEGTKVTVDLPKGIGPANTNTSSRKYGVMADNGKTKYMRWGIYVNPANYTPPNTGDIIIKDTLGSDLTLVQGSLTVRRQKLEGFSEANPFEKVTGGTMVDNGDGTFTIKVPNPDPTYYYLVNYNTSPPASIKEGTTLTNSAVVGTRTVTASQRWSTVGGTGEGVVTPVKPVNPTVTEAICEPGSTKPKDPTITLPETVGLTYTYNKDLVAPGATVPVRVTALYGYKIENAPPQWDVAADGLSAVYYVHLAEIQCAAPLTSPDDPTVKQATCDADGNVVDPQIILDESNPNITYSYDKSLVKPGATVPVTATGKNGYLIMAKGEWTGVGSQDPTNGGYASVVMNVVLDEKDCTKPVVPVNPEVKQAMCEPGDPNPTAPVITPANTPGVTYSFDKDAVKPGATVPVTATPDKGNAIDKSKLPEGWTLNDDGTATLQVKLEDKDCITLVVPVNPEVKQAMCEPGDPNPTAPVITPAETKGVTYSFDKDAVKPGATVPVTATPQNKAHVFDESKLPEGWTLNEDGTATLQVKLEDKDCITPVELSIPEVTQAVCEPGDPNPTKPTISIKETPGITYSYDKDAVKAGATVPVTAKPDAVTSIDKTKLPEGWVLNEDGTATFQVKLEDKDCVTQVVPVNPEVKQAVCSADNELVDPSITPVETEGIVYSFDKDAVKAGATVPYIATPKDKAHAFDASKLPEGWTLNEDGTATFQVKLEDKECDKPVVPVVPTFVEAQCTAADVASLPEVKWTEVGDLTYRIDGQVAQGETVRVYVDSTTGSYIDKTKLPEGFQVDENGNVYVEHTFAKVDCTPTKIVVENPKVNVSVCEAGKPTDPSVELPKDTDELAYTQEKDEDGNIIVRVSFKDETRTWVDAPAGWTIDKDKPHSMTTGPFDMSLADCEVVTPPTEEPTPTPEQPSEPPASPEPSDTPTPAPSDEPTPSDTPTATPSTEQPDGELAHTGFNGGYVAAGALLLVMVALALLMVSRRKGTHQE